MKFCTIESYPQRSEEDAEDGNSFSLVGLQYTVFSMALNPFPKVCILSEITFGELRRRREQP
jgi:hypothetical protein